MEPSYSLSVFMSPPPLSWWRLLVLMLVVLVLVVVVVVRMGMLWLSGAGGGAGVRSSSESLLLELSSLLEEELLESEELSPLLSWSMTRASAISSVNTSTKIKKCGFIRNNPQPSKSPSLTPLSMSSMGDAGDVFSLGGEPLELVEVLLLLLVLLLLFICWLRRLVCCSMREWILLLPSALGKHNHIQ